MAYQHYRSQFGDTTYTKVFVGGLAWETLTDEMRRYFEQFGELLEAVIITDKNTGRSKGYGFVTFRDPESARRACIDPNPVIDGRRANCNIASFGRPRPSPPRGRIQGAFNPYEGPVASDATPYTRVGAPPPPSLPPTVMYPSYGYTTYIPDYGYSQQAPYNPHLQPQYYHQMYGGSSSNVGGPYYYGYSLQSPRQTFPATHAYGISGPTYLQYAPHQEGSLTTFPHQTGLFPARQSVPFSTDTMTPEQTSTTTRVTLPTSE